MWTSFISFSFFFKGAKSNDPLHVDYVPSVFSFKKPETKKRASSSIERYERQQKRKKVKELFHEQSKQPVEAAEDDINLVVEEETHKDKGLLFVPSNMDSFCFSAIISYIQKYPHSSL